MEPDGFELPDDLSPLISKINEDAVAHGGFGDVYKCCLSHSTIVKTDVAVKVLRILPDDEDSKKDVRREMGIWRRARHKHIVPFFGVANNFMPSRISLVSAWQMNGTLMSLLERKRDMDYKERFFLLQDIASGLGYLHSVDIVHGDLTGLNVLIDVDGHARLTDFGLSSVVNAGEDLTYLAMTTRRLGALRWAAPELVVKDNDHIAPTFGSDIYSFGSVMLQTLSGRLPWSEIKNQNCIVIKLFEECLPQRPESLPMLDAHWNFIMLCMNLVVESRPSAAEVMEWVNGAVLLLSSASAATGGNQHFTTRLDNYLQVHLSAGARRHVRWEVAFVGPQNAITWYCTVYIDGVVYGVGVGHVMDVSRDAAARHALERLERECLTIPRSHTVQTFPYGRSDTRTQPSDSTLTHPDRGTRATNKIHTLFEAHPRTALNNLLQIMYGISMSDHVRWEVSSTGVAISPIWHATVYINDMNYGRASAASKGAAMDIAALNAWNILRREIMAQDGAT